MNREQHEHEDNRNRSSAGLGLGIAAGVVAIGVGVGTALYYLFNKRQQQQFPESLHTLVEQPWVSQEKRQEAFRQRSWTLEQCSICFEVILKDQEITSLTCTHRFHTSCVLPWLQEHETCPNCRKTINT